MSSYGFTAAAKPSIPVPNCFLVRCGIKLLPAGMYNAALSRFYNNVDSRRHEMDTSRMHACLHDM